MVRCVSLNPEDEGSTTLLNVPNCLSINAAKLRSKLRVNHELQTIYTQGLVFKQKLFTSLIDKMYKRKLLRLIVGYLTYV
jgi:hypothetical protein